MKSKVTTSLLAFFLGGFGAHRFYLGNTGVGILYLVFSWTLIPAIVSFFEAIYFLACSEDNFNSKYNVGNQENQVQNHQRSTPLEDIKSLNELKDSGAITNEEFNEKKDSLLKKVS